MIGVHARTERPLSQSSGARLAVNGPAARPAYRFGFVMQQVLGHITVYRHVRRFVGEDCSVRPAWAEVTYTQRDGWLERSPLPAGLRGSLRGILQVQSGLGRSPARLLPGRRAPAPDAVLFSTQAVCLSAVGYMRRVPSIIVTDVTPRQYDELRTFYGRGPTRSAALTRWKHRRYVEIFHAARLIVPWSSWVKGSLVRDYGVPEEKVVVVHPGVDVERWAPPPAGTREALLEASNGLPRVLFVGGDFERKGGQLLLEWFAARGQGRCELHIVTRTPPTVSAALHGLHVHTNLEANDPRLMQLYRESHMFVLPTQADCFGIASIEAMATGLPVITTSVGGVPEILEDGEQGFLIPPNDGAALAARVDYLLGDRFVRRLMGERARTRVVARFSARLHATRLLDLMKGLATPRE